MSVVQPRVAAWIATACIAGLLCPTVSRAADTAPFSLGAAALREFAESPPARDGFAVTFASDEQRFEFDEQHRLTLTSHQIYRVDSPNAVDAYGQIGALWEPYRQKKPELRARVVTRDGREFTFDPETLSDETLATGDARTFDDVHILRGPLPAISTGSVVEILAIVTDAEPKFAAGSSYVVTLGLQGAVESTSITVVTPRSSPFRYRTRLLPQAVILEQDRNGFHEFTLRQGPLALPWKDTSVEAAGDAASWPRLEFSTGRSWEEVADAYRALVEPAIRPGEARALLPADLPADPRQRLARLLEILHERVRYTGVFFGQGDIVPNPPSVTLGRRFGDCKDKSVLLASMLRAAGIPAEIALLNSGIGGDVDPELPGIGEFNHMIVYLPADDLWVDATAKYVGVGESLYQNAGRWALVIGPREHQLVETPLMQPAGNREWERRVVTLADLGLGELHVTLRLTGPPASVYRQLADNDSKEVRKRLLDQLSRNYQAKSITGYETREDPRSAEVELEFDAHRLDAAVTDMKEASITMSLADLLAKVPYGLRRKPSNGTDPDDDDDESSSSRPESRTFDWVFPPFLSELEVKVVPPRGFKLRSVPKNVDQQFGPMRLTQTFREDADGTLVGTVRADSVRGRYTADEGRAFREAYLAASPSLVLAVRFDHESWLLANSGKPAAALERHAALIRAEPNKALPRVRAAEQYLEFGLVDDAKKQAQRATQLEPASAAAFNTLGVVLQTDELGRRLGGPFDRTASIRALREAVRLDPDDLDIKLNLAGSAEHNASGLRYGAGSDIDLAVDQYRIVVAGRPDWKRGPDALLQALWQQGNYSEIVSAADRSEGSTFAAPVRLAARVMQVGSETALREDASRSNAADHRAHATFAMSILMAKRNYDEARALLASLVAEGVPERDSVFFDSLKKMIKSEDLPAPPSSATGAAEALIRLMLSGALDRKELLPWLSNRSKSDGDVAILLKDFREASHHLTDAIARLLSDDPAVMSDVVLSNLVMQETPISDRAVRVDTSIGGMQGGGYYLVQEESSWKLLGMYAFDPPVAREVQSLLKAGEASSARSWIASVRTQLEAVPEDAAGPYKYVLAALPTASSLDDPAAVRLAALALLAVKASKFADYDDLQSAAEGLTTPAQLEVLENVRFMIAWANQDGKLAMRAVDNLDRIKPGSPESMRIRALAYQAAHRWEDAEQASRDWVAQRPGDTSAKQALARALNGQGRFVDALAIFAPAVQDGTASVAQLNSYAWQALRAESIDAVAIQAAEKASSQYKPREFSTSHTLACLYAVQGRIADARRVLLQMLEDRPDVDPLDGRIWLIRGLIAESVGETAEAGRAYRQIEKPEIESPDSVFAIAATRLARLDAQHAVRVID